MSSAAQPASGSTRCRTRAHAVGHLGSGLARFPGPVVSPRNFSWVNSSHARGICGRNDGRPVAATRAEGEKFGKQRSEAFKRSEGHAPVLHSLHLPRWHLFLLLVSSSPTNPTTPSTNNQLTNQPMKHTTPARTLKLFMLLACDSSAEVSHSRKVVGQAWDKRWDTLTHGRCAAPGPTPQGPRRRMTHRWGAGGLSGRRREPGGRASWPNATRQDRK